MPWANDSRRRSQLPPDWPAIRDAVFLRDRRRCQINSDRCTGRATDVDHIDNPHDHSLTNLRAACHACHAQRSAQQGGHAAAQRRRALSRHPRERNPGQGPPPPP